MIPLLLLSCAWIGPDEFDRRIDADQDGEPSAQFGGRDCDDDDPLVVTCATPGETGGPPRHTGGPGTTGTTGTTAETGVFPHTGGFGQGTHDLDEDGYVDDAYGGRDCDDTDPGVHPGAEDPVYDGVDSACDGDRYEWDADRDGFDVIHSGRGDDCDDTDASVYPGAPGEVWYDGVDTNCDGNDCDRDGDGYQADRAPYCTGNDCNDGRADIHPGAIDDPLTLHTDENCNGNPTL